MHIVNSKDAGTILLKSPFFLSGYIYLSYYVSLNKAGWKMVLLMGTFPNGRIYFNGLPSLYFLGKKKKKQEKTVKLYFTDTSD